MPQVFNISQELGRVCFCFGKKILGGGGKKEKKFFGWIKLFPKQFWKLEKRKVIWNNKIQQIVFYASSFLWRGTDPKAPTLFYF